MATPDNMHVPRNVTLELSVCSLIGPARRVCIPSQPPHLSPESVINPIQGTLGYVSHVKFS